MSHSSRQAPALRVFLPPDHARHDPDSVIGSGAAARPYFERPARIDALLRAVTAAGLQAEAPRDHGLAPIEALHEEGYLRFLASAYDAWRAEPGFASDPVVRPTAFAVRPLHRKPSSVVGLAGWYLAGHGAPLLQHSWSAAVASAHAAVEAADTVLAGARQAYALTRPPGHHAHADLAGGFCFLNNAAIAAQRLRDGGVARVGLLDIDVHHGNGTQAIFYEREDVHVVSVHGDPAGLYPFYAGYADETGAAAGVGRNLNLPLPAGTTDKAWLEAVERGLEALRRPGLPDVLVLSLGFDAQAGDPTANLAVTAEGFRGAGRRIADLGLPTVIIQEGGYLIEKLEANLTALLQGFLSARA
nr:histone deacetylase family protein [uncultured Roseococcus sp.]